MIKPPTDTTLLRRVRDLRPPTSAGFDASQWVTAYREFGQTADDEQLVRTALWIATEARRAHKHFSADEPQVGSKVVPLAVATLNSAFEKIQKGNASGSDRSIRAGAISLDHAIRSGISGGVPGQSAEIDTLVEAIVEATELWLKATPTTEGPSYHSQNLAKVASQSLLRYTLQRAHNGLWQQALWEGWRLDQSQGLRWKPSDRGFASLMYAWNVRQVSNSTNDVVLDLLNWQLLPIQTRRDLQLPRSVVSVKTLRGQKRRIIVARPPDRLNPPPQFFIDARLAENCYLREYLDDPFSTNPQLTCRLLLRAWHVLVDLVQVTNTNNKKPLKLVNIDNVRKTALAFRKHEIETTLSDALAVCPSVAVAIIEFLTWSPTGYKGLWGAPLLTSSISDEICIARPILETSSLVRRIEIWLTKGGLDLGSGVTPRGIKFEANLRRDINETLQGNNVITAARCSKNAVKRSREFPEQIDLLIKIGDTLIVGEVKCFLTPADAHECFNALKKLRLAAEQAERKARLISQNLGVAARALELTENEVRKVKCIPLVVTNQGFGVSVKFGDCIVTDTRLLLLYLSGGQILLQSAISIASGQAVFAETNIYETAVEAEERILEFFEGPPALIKLLGQVKWSISEFPTSLDTKLLIDTPQLADVSDEDAKEARLLQSILDVR